MTDAHTGEHDEPGGVHAVPDTEAGRSDSFGRKIRSIEAAAIAGIAFSVLGGIALTMLASFPDLDQSDAQLSAWFDDSANQTTLIIGCNLMAVSSIMFLWFVAVIRRRLGELEDRFFGTVFLGSALAFVAVWLGHGAAIAGPAIAMSHIEGASVSGASASNAAGLGAAYLLVIAPRIQAVFILVTSTLIMRSRVLPRWLAIVGYLVALGMLIVPLILESLGLGFPLWVFLVSIVILIVGPRARETQAEPVR
jgi:hypothetical protein